MGGDRHIVDIPCDLLCRILQYCCDGNVYNLSLFSTVSKAFRTAVLTVCSSLEVADMRYFHATGPTSDVQWRTTAMVNGVLKCCPRLAGLLLISCHWQSSLALSRTFHPAQEHLCVLQLHHCTLSHGALLALGQALPHLQGLSLSGSAIVDTITHPWNGFPQLKMLSVDWMRTVTWRSLLPLRSQLLYLSCHGCMRIDDALCDGLDSCVALDLANTPVSDAGLQSLLAKETPKLKLLVLNTKAGNLWDDGAWTPAMIARMQSKGVQVIQSAGYKTSVPALVVSLGDALRNDPLLLKHAKYVL